MPVVSARPTAMSMIGLAGRPGTAVEPMCSIAAAPPIAAAIRSRSAAKAAGHPGS